MRRFELHRAIDVSGVSGTGFICEGVEFTDGTAATRWVNPHTPVQTTVWACVDDVVAIHGHGGTTVLHWLDDIDLP